MPEKFEGGVPPQEREKVSEFSPESVQQMLYQDSDSIDSLGPDEEIQTGELWIDQLEERLDNLNEEQLRQLSDSLAQASFRGGDMGVFVVEHLEKFRGIDQKDLALKLIKQSRDSGEILARNFEKFGSLSPEDISEIADAFFDNHQGYILAGSIEKVDPNGVIDRTKLIDKLIATSESERVSEQIPAWQLNALARNIVNFGEVDRDEVASKIIEAGGARYIAENLPNFPGVDQEKLVDRLLEERAGYWIAYYLENFTQIKDKKVIGERLLEKGEMQGVATFFEKFEGMDPEKTAEILMKDKEHSGPLCLARALDKFPNVDREEFLSDLIARREWFTIMENDHRFKDVAISQADKEKIRKAAKEFRQSDEDKYNWASYVVRGLLKE